MYFLTEINYDETGYPSERFVGQYSSLSAAEKDAKELKRFSNGSFVINKGAVELVTENLLEPLN